MRAFQYDEDGYLLGMIDCDPHPLRAQGWIVPGMATLAVPPVAQKGMAVRWNGSAWCLVPMPKAPKPSLLARAKQWIAGMVRQRGML